MGKFFYNLSIKAYVFALHIARKWNVKAAKMLDGRKGLWDYIQIKCEQLHGDIAWFHCASLGEFEQARPIIEKYKNQYPAHKVVITFFSPSGYEIRMDYSEADAIFYLPFDSRKNANRFIQLLHPCIAFFIKYEFWYYYLDTLRLNNIPVFSVSSIFRPEQIYFKAHAKFYFGILTKFNHFFVQNESSQVLLEQHGLNNVTLSGDTRFDRVAEIIKHVEKISLAKKFKGNSKLMVIGSSWIDDMEIIAPFINKWAGKFKFIIAPHEVSEKNIAAHENFIDGNKIRFSQAKNVDFTNYDVLMIDNVGMLYSLYQYGEFAYVGGAFSEGLHNILEPAAFGIPVIFGKHVSNRKFKEAIELTVKGGGFEISLWQEMDRLISRMLNDFDKYEESSMASSQYVKENVGATETILREVDKILRLA